MKSRDTRLSSSYSREHDINWQDVVQHSTDWRESNKGSDENDRIDMTDQVDFENTPSTSSIVNLGESNRRARFFLFDSRDFAAARAASSVIIKGEANNGKDGKVSQSQDGQPVLSWDKSVQDNDDINDWFNPFHEDVYEKSLYSTEDEAPIEVIEQIRKSPLYYLTKPPRKDDDHKTSESQFDEAGNWRTSNEITSQVLHKCSYGETIYKNSVSDEDLTTSQVFSDNQPSDAKVAFKSLVSSLKHSPGKVQNVLDAESEDDQTVISEDTSDEATIRSEEESTKIEYEYAKIKEEEDLTNDVIADLVTEKHVETVQLKVERDIRMSTYQPSIPKGIGVRPRLPAELLRKAQKRAFFVAVNNNEVPETISKNQISNVPKKPNVPRRKGKRRAAASARERMTRHWMMKRQQQQEEKEGFDRGFETCSSQIETDEENENTELADQADSDTLYQHESEEERTMRLKQIVSDADEIIKNLEISASELLQKDIFNEQQLKILKDSRDGLLWLVDDSIFAKEFRSALEFLTKCKDRYDAIIQKAPKK